MVDFPAAGAAEEDSVVGELSFGKRKFSKENQDKTKNRSEF